MFSHCELNNHHICLFQSEPPEFAKGDEDGDPEADDGVAEEGMSGDEEQEEDEDEEEEEEDEEGGEGMSHGVLSDGDAYEQSNSSLPNSDISTVSHIDILLFL